MEDPSSVWIAICIMAVTMVMKVSIGLYSYTEDQCIAGLELRTLALVV